jgi:biotin operon repressor
MIIPDAIVHELFLNPELRKSDTRTVIFLLQNEGAISNKELATGIGVSQKSANKSIKRLVAGGVLGETQAKRRTFIVQLSESQELPAGTEGNKDASFGAFTDRLDRIETMIGALLARPVTVSAPDGQTISGVMPVCSHDVQNVAKTVPIQSPMIPATVTDGIEQDTYMTGTATIQAIEEPSENIQAEMMSENGQKESKTLCLITEQGTKGTLNDTINDDLDGAIIRAGARLAALKAASLLKEKQQQQQPGAHASIGDEFHALFGVQLPSGSDQAAATVMIARKKAGKLDNVKSPLAYLASLAGKVQSPITPAPAIQTSVSPAPVQSQAINSLPDNGLNEFIRMHEIKAAWFEMNAEQRMPFHELREKKNMSGMPSGKVPVELLAFQQFTQECLAGRVQI